MADSIFSTEGYITIAYLIAIFGIGVWGARKTHSFRDYYSTGSRLGIVFLAGTVLATQWGGVTLLGIAGFGYQHLWLGVWYSLGTVVRFLFWAFILAIVLRKVNAFSISEWFGLRFDGKNAVIMTALNLIVSLGLLGGQFLAFGSVVTVFFDVPFRISVIIGAVAVTAYTVLGGMWGVAYTDTVQIIISGAAAVGMVIYLRTTEGGFSVLRNADAFSPEYFDPMTIPALGDWSMGWLFFVTLIFLWLADLFVNLNLQRMVSARTLRTAYWAPVFGAVSYVLVAFISPSIGAYARFVLGDLENPDFAFPALAQELLPAYLAGLVAAALLAVVMSTGDSNLLGPSTLAANDFYRAFRPDASEANVLLAARVITIAYAAIALLASFYFQTIIGLILAFLTIGWAVVPALWASVAWRRATSNGVFASMVIGGGINFVLMASQSFNLIPAVAEMNPGPSYYAGWVGFFAAIVVLIGVSLAEGEESVPAHIRRQPVTDGGTQEDDLVDRARPALKQLHF